MSWRGKVLMFMRVPPTPAHPPGSPPRVFRAAPNYFKLRMVGWGIAQILALGGLIWAYFFIDFMARSNAPRSLVWMMQVGEALAWTALVIQIIFGWMLIRLDYEMRWYMLSDRAIRIREGVTTVREKTVVLANIQNIAVRQGPLQRLLGIADVEVKTAGGGGQATKMDQKHSEGEPMHVAYFRGVDNAEEIRDLLREGVRRQRDAGLGDPDEIEHEDVAEVPSVPGDDPLRHAASELLTEARMLRAVVERAAS
jgi:uncharacterized membrane protein YdbT with pleckstrin-like domain